MKNEISVHAMDIYDYKLAQERHSQRSIDSDDDFTATRFIFHWYLALVPSFSISLKDYKNNCRNFALV
jgi:hypothetical protein